MLACVNSPEFLIKIIFLMRFHKLSCFFQLFLSCSIFVSADLRLGKYRLPLKINLRHILSHESTKALCPFYHENIFARK